ncbi:MAG: hypothetical protein Q9209_002034 [Squamulea sp. 1 TL-2023]
MPSATEDTVLSSRPPKSGPPNPRSRFRQLVVDIRDQLGSDNSIVSSDQDCLLLQQRLLSYISEETGWENYAFRDATQSFTRNLVYRGNGKYNLILKGSLKETRYAWPENVGPGQEMKTTKETTFGRDQVTYMADSLGLHKISNSDPDEYAVSLHRRTAITPSAE